MMLLICSGNSGSCIIKLPKMRKPSSASTTIVFALLLVLPLTQVASAGIGIRLSKRQATAAGAKAGEDEGADSSSGPVPAIGDAVGLEDEDAEALSQFEAESERGSRAVDMAVESLIGSTSSTQSSSSVTSSSSETTSATSTAEVYSSRGGLDKEPSGGGSRSETRPKKGAAKKQRGAKYPTVKKELRSDAKSADESDDDIGEEEFKEPPSSSKPSTNSAAEDGASKAGTSRGAMDALDDGEKGQEGDEGARNDMDDESDIEEDGLMDIGEETEESRNDTDSLSESGEDALESSHSSTDSKGSEETDEYSSGAPDQASPSSSTHQSTATSTAGPEGGSRALDLPATTDSDLDVVENDIAEATPSVVLTIKGQRKKNKRKRNNKRKGGPMTTSTAPPALVIGAKGKTAIAQNGTMAPVNTATKKHPDSLLSSLLGGKPTKASAGLSIGPPKVNDGLKMNNSASLAMDGAGLSGASGSGGGANSGAKAEGDASGSAEVEDKGVVGGSAGAGGLDKGNGTVVVHGKGSEGFGASASGDKRDFNHALGPNIESEVGVVSKAKDKQSHHSSTSTLDRKTDSTTAVDGVKSQNGTSETIMRTFNSTDSDNEKTLWRGQFSLSSPPGDGGGKSTKSRKELKKKKKKNEKRKKKRKRTKKRILQGKFQSTPLPDSLSPPSTVNPGATAPESITNTASSEETNLKNKTATASTEKSVAAIGKTVTTLKPDPAGVTPITASLPAASDPSMGSGAAPTITGPSKAGLSTPDPAVTKAPVPSATTQAPASTPAASISGSSMTPTKAPEAPEVPTAVKDPVKSNDQLLDKDRYGKEYKLSMTTPPGKPLATTSEPKAPAAAADTSSAAQARLKDPKSPTKVRAVSSTRIPAATLGGLSVSSIKPKPGPIANSPTEANLSVTPLPAKPGAGPEAAPTILPVSPATATAISKAPVIVTAIPKPGTHTGASVKPGPLRRIMKSRKGRMSKCGRSGIKDTDHLVALVMNRQGKIRMRKLNSKVVEKMMAQERKVAATSAMPLIQGNSYEFPAGQYYFPKSIRFVGLVSM